MSELRVLLTNITLATRTGTEINVRDIALRLLARGHAPVVYTPDPGDIADELRAATIPVVDDLRRVRVAPDVIHGHHHPETMTALLSFPGVPAVFFSHDVVAWHDAAPRFPRIQRYVAVDDANRDRLACAHGIAADRIRVILNAVDLERFAPRPPLPARPQRALLFAGEVCGVGVVREACMRAGLSLDVVGAGEGTAIAAPEGRLGEYDLVFARGRCALEALAVGAAVVLCGYGRAGPMVTSAELERLRRHNFGRRLLHEPLEPERLTREIARYDPADAAEVSRRIRATAGLEAQVDELMALYREVIAENASGTVDLGAEENAAAVYLRAWGPRFKDGPLRSERDYFRAECERLQADRDGLARGAEGLEQKVRELEQASRRMEQACRDLEHGLVNERAVSEQSLRREHTAEMSRVRAERDQLKDQLGYVVGTTTWRFREFLLRSRSLTAMYRVALRATGRRVTA